MRILAALLLLLTSVPVWAAVAAPPRACAGSMTAVSLRLRVKTPSGGDPLAIRRVNNIPEGTRILYSPLQMPADLKKNGRIALVVVPADLEQRSASGASVLEPHGADTDGEWTTPYRASVVLLVFGPQGLDEKRLTNLVSKDGNLLDDLARFAQQTSDLEASLEQVAALEEAEMEEDPSRPTRATPIEQALFTLTRALNPSSAFSNPLGAGKMVGPVTRSTWAASTFFDNAGGLFPGSGALGMVRQWLMPDSEFRAVYAENTGSDGLSLCGQKQQSKSKNRIVYMWGYKPVNTDAPPLSEPQTAYLPSGTRSTFALKTAQQTDWTLIDRIRDWTLSGGARDIPVKLHSVARGWVEIDLRKAAIDPGVYKLKGKWDWDTVMVDGDLRIAALGDMTQARVTADSQLRLVEGAGMAPIELEGADFQFVERVSFKRAGTLGAANSEVDYRLPGGVRPGPQQKLELEIDTSRYRAGSYVLAIQQTGGVTQEVPVEILPPLPRIDGLPLRLNRGEASQQITLRGSGLDRIDSFEADGMRFQLGPAAVGSQRDATVLIAANASPAAIGTQLAASYKLAGLLSPVRVPAAFQIAGPKPVISSAVASAADDSGVAIRDGELSAGSQASFTLKVSNVEAPASMVVECAEPAKQVQPLRVRLGERRTDAKLDSIGPGTLFASFDPGAVGQTGCTLNAAIETDAAGKSAPLALGRVVRVPKIDGLTWTEERSNGGYYAILRGADLETIERAGWDAQTGIPVTALPKSSGDRQSMRIVLPWPPPSPLAPIWIWLRGESLGRMVRFLKAQ
jgi:hypothetical protein